MRTDGTVWECEPGHPRFDALATAKRLSKNIEMHQTPQGLVAYWNMEKNRKRLALMKDSWKAELETRFQARLKVLKHEPA